MDEQVGVVHVTDFSSLGAIKVRTVVFSHDWRVLGHLSFSFDDSSPAPTSKMAWHVHNMHVLETLGLVGADTDPHVLSMSDFDGDVTPEMIATIRAEYDAGRISKTEQFHYGKRPPSDYLAPTQPSGTWTARVVNGRLDVRVNPERPTL